MTTRSGKAADPSMPDAVSISRARLERRSSELMTSLGEAERGKTQALARAEEQAQRVLMIHGALQEIKELLAPEAT